MDVNSPVRHHQPATGMVGRNQERETLRRLLESAAGSQGRIALISGAAGIGKTALVRDLIDVARERGFQVLFGGCYDGLATAPYEPWYEALISTQDPHAPASQDLISYLQECVPDAGTISNGQMLTRALQAALKLATRDQPALLVLEDLHWADTASLDLLLWVARALPGLPLLLVGTWRDEAESMLAASPSVSTLARDSECTWLALQRLDGAGVEALVQQRYQLPEDDRRLLVELLDRYADGNPLFVQEILRELELGGQLRVERGGWRVGDLRDVNVPPVVQQLIAAGLDGLPPKARELLAVGAVLGQSFSYDLWQLVSGADDDELAAALAAAQDSHILPSTRRGDTLEFQHALIREVLHQKLPPPVRRDLHRRAADQLLAGHAQRAPTRGAPLIDAGRVAVHLLEAGDERAAEWLQRAGDRAERAYAWPDAIERFLQALRALPPEAEVERTRGWISYRIAYLNRYGDLGLALTALDDALESANAAHDDTLLAYERYARGLAHIYTGSAQRGIEVLLEAIVLLEGLPPVDRLRLNAAPTIMDPDALPLPTSRFEPPADPEAPDRPLLGDVDRRAAVALMLTELGRLQEAQELIVSCREALAHWPGEAVWGRTGYLLLTSGYVHALAGRPAESVADFDEAGRMFEGSPVRLLLFELVAHRLMLLGWSYHTDRLSARRAQIAEARRVEARLGEFIGGGLAPDHWLILTHFMEGRWELVERLIGAHGLSGPGGRYHQHIHWVAALLLRERGRPDEAWSWLRRLLPDGERSQPGNTEFLSSTRAMVLAAELALDAGDIQSAERWLDVHERWMQWNGALLGAAEGVLARARLARSSGDPDAARERAYRALALAVEPRQPLAQAAIWRFIAALDVDAGDLVAAGEHLDRSTALAESCETPPEVLACRIVQTQLLVALGKPERAGELAAEIRVQADALDARRLLGLLDAIDLDLIDESNSVGAQLSARELEVLACVALGLTDAQVGEQLYIATRTVNAHMRSIRAKLRVDSRLSAVRAARERGLI